MSTINRRTRWDGTTEDDRKATMAHARAGLLVGAVAKAKAQAEVLGVTLTDEQAEAAGARILRNEQAQRAREQQARATAAAVEARKVANADWALGQMLSAIRSMLTFEPGLHTPTLASVMSDVTREELDAPDGFNKRRLTKRLDGFIQRAKEQAQKRSGELTAMLPIADDWEWSPTADDVAEDEGRPSWSGLPPFEAEPGHPDAE
jgi:hypothetical protein